MEYVKCLQTSIDYIENNLNADITISECAQKAGYSLYHYCRVFQMTTKISIMDYIRNRRLTKAAAEIFESNYKINEICYKWGFNSPENFIRAFKRLFGITPSSFRKTKSSLNLFHSIDLSKSKLLTYDDDFHIKPKFIIKPSFKFAGYNICTNEINGEKTSDASKMWNAYHANNLGESIPNRVIKNKRYDIGMMINYGLSIPSRKYYIGVEVENFNNMPENIMMKTIPTSKYAIFSTPKADTFTFVSNIHKTWNYIYQQWFPNYGYTHLGTHEFETYCENSKTFSEDIYIPVKKIKE